MTMERTFRVAGLVYMCLIIHHLPHPTVCENPIPIPINGNTTLNDVPRIYEEIVRLVEMASANFTIVDDLLSEFLHEIPTDLLTNVPDDVLQSILAGFVNGAIESGLAAAFPEDVDRVSETCLSDLTTFFQDLVMGNDYALRMLASNGKFPSLSDIYNFNFQSLGDYDLCVGAKGAPFDTKQCGLSLYFNHWSLKIAICSPVSCSKDDLKWITNAVIALPDSLLNDTVDFNLDSIYLDFECIDEVPWSGGSIATLTLLTIFAVLVVFGTAHDVTVNKKLKKIKYVQEKEIRSETNRGYNNYEDTEKGKPVSQEDDDVDSEALEAAEVCSTSSTAKVIKSPSSMEQKGVESVVPDIRQKAPVSSSVKDTYTPNVFEEIILSFSATKNGSKILNIGNSSGQFGCLNGIRVLSMWWVILGHALFFAYARYDNLTYVYSVAIDFTFLAIINATFSVDTFFVLSGLLLTYITLKHLKKTNGRLNWFLFYFHRFWRLTPSYMMSIAIFSTLFVYFGKGHGKIQFAEYATNACRDYWWTNLLYINNLYPFPGSLSYMCMGWSWYLANDMQFFVISPILIILLYKNWKIGLTGIGVLCAASFGITAWISYYWGLNITGSVLEPVYYNDRTTDTAEDRIYTKPYCRIPAFLVGMTLGFILHRLDKKTIKLPPMAVFVGWTAAVGTGIAVIYGIWGVYRGETPSHEIATFYNTVSRFAWSVAVGWIIFACITGYGGFVNTILSCGFWSPLARLSYGAYLLHPIVMYAVVYSWKSLFHFSYVNYSFFYVGCIVFSYISSFILSILIEGPFMQLEKVIFRKAKKE